MVRLIKQNKEAEKTMETDFILAHNLYARAEIPPTDKVKFKFLNLNIKRSLSF
jgi:hypothetical protein